MYQPMMICINKEKKYPGDDFNINSGENDLMIDVVDGGIHVLFITVFLPECLANQIASVAISKPSSF
jgi:hypothetical protein